MNKSLITYNLALGLAGTALPALWLGSRLSGRWGELWPRLGLYRNLAPAPPGPRVWLQAVSVGEVGVALALAQELWARRPEINLAVSSSTAKGLERAAQVFANRARVLPFPLEAPWAVAAACNKVRPHVYASLETELWPNLLARLERSGATLLLLNGRISPRSFPRYQWIRPLVAGCLRRFQALSMISEADAQRVIALGAPDERVRVDGNAKYTGLLEQAQAADTNGPAARLNLNGAPLLVAGSARSGEEGPVLAAFAALLREHPTAVLAVAPRHLERAPRWLAAARGQGLAAQAWSGLSEAAPRRAETRVVVIDAMGALMALYGLCRAAFLGASLVPLGGQNPLEPAAWGVPMVFGPDMADFSDAAQVLLAAGAAQVVPDADGLARAWSGLLDDPAEAKRRGQAGREVLAGWSGAAATAADLVLTQLERRGV